VLGDVGFGEVTSASGEGGWDRSAGPRHARHFRDLFFHRAAPPFVLTDRHRRYGISIEICGCQDDGLVVSCSVAAAKSARGEL
jgi:hypothetical protein